MTAEGQRARFDRKGAGAHPPLPEAEVEAIWRSATRFAKGVESEPGYLPPDEYEASLESVRPGDYSDVGQAQAPKAAYPDVAVFGGHRLAGLLRGCLV